MHSDNMRCEMYLRGDGVRMRVPARMLVRHENGRIARTGSGGESEGDAQTTVSDVMSHFVEPPGQLARTASSSVGWHSTRMVSRT